MICNDALEECKARWLDRMAVIDFASPDSVFVFRARFLNFDLNFVPGILVEILSRMCPSRNIKRHTILVDWG